jgi:hypothetical protein
MVLNMFGKLIIFGNSNLYATKCCVFKTLAPSFVNY